MKKLLVSFLILAFSFMLMGNAEALQYKTISRTNGTAAFAEWYSEDGEMATDTFIEVDEYTYGTDVFYSSCEYNMSTFEFLCWFGYYFTNDDILQINKKLNTATLSPVEMEIWDDWGNSQIATIEAQWNGYGQLQKGQFKISDKFGNFMAKFRQSVTYRDANSSIQINDNDLGESYMGGLVKFRTADFYMEK